MASRKTKMINPTLEKQKRNKFTEERHIYNIPPENKPNQTTASGPTKRKKNGKEEFPN